jgi:DNA-binding CsgD family transcriptional regulator
VLPELIEAAVRTGDTRLASDALDLLTKTTRAGGTDLGVGIRARSHALLSEGKAAEDCYHEAIARLGRTRRRPDLARAHLLFGEWLRRERRRGEAREQLRTACQMLDEMGMEAFAERARRELAAAGETVAKRIAQSARTRPGQASELLTSQEAQVARLARNGLSNPEIATRLFISTRTVQYHLSKVFAKLGIKSRAELHRVLPTTWLPSGYHGPSELVLCDRMYLMPGSGVAGPRTPTGRIAPSGVGLRCGTVTSDGVRLWGRGEEALAGLRDELGGPVADGILAAPAEHDRHAIAALITRAVTVWDEGQIGDGLEFLRDAARRDGRRRNRPGDRAGVGLLTELGLPAGVPEQQPERVAVDGADHPRMPPRPRRESHQPRESPSP